MVAFFRRVLADVLTWLRSKLDKAAFAIGGDTWLFASVVLAVSAALQALGIGDPQLPAILAGLGALGTVVFLIHDFTEHFELHTGWEVSQLGPPFTTALTLHEPNLPTRVSTTLGTVFTSPRLNAALADTSSPIELRQVPFQLDGWLRKHASTLLRKTGPAAPFNGRCVRLDTDLSIGGLASNYPVAVRPARYFHALCSSQLTMWRIARDGELWPFHDRLCTPRRTTRLARAA